MTKHYQPPTVEDDGSECNTNHFAPQFDGNQTAIIPRDQSQTTSSSTTSSTVSPEHSSNGGSESNSQPTAPNPIGIECWNRILQLYEEYQHQQSHAPHRQTHLANAQCPSQKEKQRDPTALGIAQPRSHGAAEALAGAETPSWGAGAGRGECVCTWPGEREEGLAG